MLKAADAILLKSEGFFKKLDSQESPFPPLFVSVERISRKWKWHIVFEECIVQQSKSSVGSIYI